MDAATGLTITVKIDTSSARQDVHEFQRYALQVLEDIRAAYAAMENDLLPGARRSV
jgi:hypothetical protein